MIFYLSKNGQKQKMDISLNINGEMLDFLKTHSASFYEEAKRKYSNVVLSLTFVPLPLEYDISKLNIKGYEFEWHRYDVTLSKIIEESKYAGFFHNRYESIMSQLNKINYKLINTVESFEMKSIVRETPSRFLSMFGDDLNRYCSIKDIRWIFDEYGELYNDFFFEE